MSIYEAIRERHSEARTLLASLGEFEIKDADSRRKLFDQFKIEIWVQQKTEEAVFYAPLDQLNGLTEIIKSACKEHKIINCLVEELDNTPADSELWSARFEVLRELIEQHIKGEEENILPQAQELLNESQAQDMGQKIVARFRVINAALAPALISGIESSFESRI